MKRQVEDYRSDRPVVAEIAAGAVLVHRPTGEVLLLHHRPEDRWCFPKGHVEAGESVRQAAHREVVEETGITDFALGEELAEVAYRFFDPRKGVNVHKTTIYLVARTDHREARPEPLFDEFRWMPVPGAIGLVAYDTDRRVLERLDKLREEPGAGRRPSG